MVLHRILNRVIFEACKEVFFLVMTAISPILILGCIGSLISNEVHSISGHKAYGDALKIDIDLVKDTQQINADLNGKLIHFSGNATTDSPVYDPDFGVGNQSGDNFLKVRRTVEMYQWVEDEEFGHDDVTYTYTKEWKDSVVDSAYFHDNASGQYSNPESMLFQNRKIVAEDILVGAFLLSSDIVDKMNWWEYVPNSLSMDSVLDESISSKAKLYGSVFYFGKDYHYPKVGDTRVFFEVVPSQEISVVAKKTASGLSAYISKTGRTVLLVEAGYHDEAEMFRHANHELTAEIWGNRLVGWLFLYITCYWMMRPSSFWAYCFGSLLEVGICYLSLGFATGTTTIIIAIASIVNWPLLSAILLSVLGLGSWLTVNHVRRNNQQRNRRFDIPEFEMQEAHTAADSVFVDEP